MAEKVTAKKEESNDLATLMPNREIMLAGETITVREYSFKDALTIGNDINQFVALIVNEMNGTNIITIEQVDTIFINNLELIYSLISTSIQKPISFIESLSYSDGLQLLDWWWVVNSGFFMNAVTRKIIRQNAAKQVDQ
ncbi:hypothetical protein J3U57_06235 [Gilliamella sp. B3464]|uniref:DUF6631 family protein n=1 Tax=unclassified Gilliamella TaxID=2685620 RepID=UPI00226AA32F|nr:MULTISPECIES: DUF6631 family protein [unclassified Gilliamella]MCX8712289.1 hypothetical protein [Gilliamella sp. B3468]MCX8751165.1 hypothetical protein [Gilliamella sp. B3464]